MSNDINVYFAGDEKTILDNIDNHIPFLNEPSWQCELLNHIRVDKLLGEGTYGKVYRLKIVGSSDISNYVLKLTGPINLEVSIKITQLMSLIEFFYLYQNIFVATQLDETLTQRICDMNGLEQNLVIPQIRAGTTLKVLIRPIRDCFLKQNVIFIKNDRSSESVSINRGSYLCDDIIKEDIISIYTSKFYENGKLGETKGDSDFNIHFLKTLSFLLCNTSPIPGVLEAAIKNSPNILHTTRSNNYLFIERIDGEFKSSIKCLEERQREYLFIQTVFTLCFLEKYQIVHNDLHLGNLFIKYIDENTWYNSRKLMQIDYFSYTVRGITFYTPFIPVLLKIGDFGQSLKFSDPQVLSTREMKDEFLEKNLIPNFFSPVTDIVSLCFNWISFDKKNKLVAQVVEWIFGGAKKLEFLNIKSGKVYTYFYKHFQHVSAFNLLKMLRDIRPSLFKKPEGTSIELGRIS